MAEVAEVADDTDHRQSYNTDNWDEGLADIDNFGVGNTDKGNSSYTGVAEHKSCNCLVN